MTTESPLTPVIILDGHSSQICGIAWSYDGCWLASASKDHTVRIWDPYNGALRCILRGHTDEVFSVAWSPTHDLIASAGKDSQVIVWNLRKRTIRKKLIDFNAGARALAWSKDGLYLACGSDDNRICIWNPETESRMWINQHTNWVRSLAWSANGKYLLSASDDKTIRIWEVQTGKQMKKLTGHSGWVHMAVWSPDERMIVSSSEDSTVRVWDAVTGRALVVLEAHSAPTCALSFSADGSMLASKSEDNSVLVWDVKAWSVSHSILEPIGDVSASLYQSISFSPLGRHLATLGEGECKIRIWPIIKLKQLTINNPRYETKKYVSAKLALLGDQQVGKTTLGYRLATGTFKLFARTHGQHYWAMPAISDRTLPGAQCDAVLWDFAGQPDYRLVHSLFLENIHVAIILICAADCDDPLSGARYWLKALPKTQNLKSTILVATQVDVAPLSITPREIHEFCDQCGVSGGFVATSAQTGEGINDLIQILRQSIDWASIPTIVSTRAFSCTRELIMKAQSEMKNSRFVLLNSFYLMRELAQEWKHWKFENAEIVTALSNLENHGIITLLPSKRGGIEILLAPEVLINVAARITIYVRSNVAGLASIREESIYSQLIFEELDGISDLERQIILEAAVSLFLRQNVCFREQVGSEAVLVFPSLLHSDKLSTTDQHNDNGPSYIVDGRVEQIFSVVVILLRYTNIFQSVDYGKGFAEYSFGDKQKAIVGRSRCRNGSMRLTLYFGNEATPQFRQLFESLFETFLYERTSDITKIPNLTCAGCGYSVRIDELEQRIKKNKTFLFCTECGNRIEISLSEGKAYMFSNSLTKLLEKKRSYAHGRSEYEASMTYLRSFLRGREKCQKRKCFVSYAWGDEETEKWVVSLATDLEDAGIDILLDKKDNTAIGKNIGRFVSEGIYGSDFIAVVGTPLYLEKYQNKVSDRGSIVAAEIDLIHQRLIGSEESKETVLPLILEGTEESSLPPLLRRRVYGDFRKPSNYFLTLFDLIMVISGLSLSDAAIMSIRQQLQETLLVRPSSINSNTDSHG